MQSAPEKPAAGLPRTPGASADPLVTMRQCLVAMFGDWPAENARRGVKDKVSKH